MRETDRVREGERDRQSEREREKNRDSWGSSVKVAGDKGRHSHGLFQNQEERPRRQRVRGTHTKVRGFNLSAFNGKETH